MSAAGQAFKSVNRLIALLVILCAVFVPLGIWKAVELIVWSYKHVHISFS